MISQLHAYIRASKFRPKLKFECDEPLRGCREAKHPSWAINLLARVQAVSEAYYKNSKFAVAALKFNKIKILTSCESKLEFIEYFLKGLTHEMMELHANKSSVIIFLLFTKH